MIYIIFCILQDSYQVYFDKSARFLGSLFCILKESWVLESKIHSTLVKDDDPISPQV